MRQIFHALLFLVVCTSISLAQELSISLGKCTGNTGVFKVKKASMKCQDEDYCTWGSIGEIRGRFSIGDISTETPVVTASLYGYNFFNDTVDICDGQVTSRDGGYYCPSPGIYNFYTDITLPENPGYGLSMFTNMISLTAKATIDFGDAVVYCSATIEGNSASYSSMIMGSALFAVGLVMWKRKKRSYLISKEDLEGDYEMNSPTSGFVEMS